MSEEKKNVWQKILAWIGAVLGAIGLLSLLRRGNSTANSERIESVGNIIDSSEQLADISREQNRIARDTARSAGQDVSSARESVKDSLDLIDRIKKRNGVK